MKTIFFVVAFMVAFTFTGLCSHAADADSLPQPSGTPASSASGAPTSATPAASDVVDQPGDVMLTPENPVSNNPLPAAPKLELNMPTAYAPALPRSCG